MVWGMERIGSGMFGPHGTFRGEKERLDALGEKLSMDEKAQIAAPDRDPKNGFSYAYEIHTRLLKDAGPLADHELPRKFFASERPKKLGSLIELAEVRAVDESLKNIIERLEPGVHQFWPVQIVMPNGDEYPNQYYGMIVLRHLDSFLPEHSDPACFRGQEIMPEKTLYSVRGISPERYAGLAVSRSIIGPNHIWRETHMTTPTLLFSDELQAEIKKAGLRIPKHFKLTVV